MFTPLDLARRGQRNNPSPTPRQDEALVEPARPRIPLDAPHRKAVDALTRSKVEAGLLIAPQKANKQPDPEIRDLIMGEVDEIKKALENAEPHQLLVIENNALIRFRYIAGLLGIPDSEFQREIEYYINSSRD